MDVVLRREIDVHRPPDHNIPPGPLQRCQVCGFTDLELVIDLGHQPLCDSLLTDHMLKTPEITYPLRQLWCPNCTLSQLDFIVPGEVVYYPDYVYRTGVTSQLVEYLRELASQVVQDLHVPRQSLVVDIGSNDGTLLAAFSDLDMRVVGVEPTNIARFAIEKGIATTQSPFDSKVALQIVETFGKAQVATATNVFAHMASLGEFISALDILLADDGHFVLENHYLPAITERLQFDSIYHEHLRSYSLRSLVVLFGFYDFTVVAARETSRYGGNIRVVVAKGKGHRVDESVGMLLKRELDIGLGNSEYYERFRTKSHALKNDLLELVLTCSKQGKQIVGNSCPGRCSTLLNFAGIGPDLLPYIAEQPASLKIGKYLPGMHIPIVNNQRLFDDQPDFVILLAWHYADSIVTRLRNRGLRSQLVVPMPKIKMLSIDDQN